jgi:hypothetical protein
MRPGLIGGGVIDEKEYRALLEVERAAEGMANQLNRYIGREPGEPLRRLNAALAALDKVRRE